MDRESVARQLRELADKLDPPPPPDQDPLADPAALARFLLRASQRLRAFMEPSLFADPGRDILLDLFVARADNKPVSVTACCAAAGVPHTTGLRWVQLLRKRGYLKLRDDVRDRRRSWVELTPESRNAMQAYLGEVSRSLPAAEASDAPPRDGEAPDRYAASRSTRPPPHPTA